MQLTLDAPLPRSRTRSAKNRRNRERKTETFAQRYTRVALNGGIWFEVTDTAFLSNPPTLGDINPGDQCLADPRSRSCRRGGLFLLERSGVRILRRLKPIGSDRLRLFCPNEALVPPEILTNDKVCIVGRVIAVCRYEPGDRRPDTL